MSAEGKIRSRYAGHELLGPLVETYVQELPAAIAELAAAMVGSDRGEVERLSHRLSGDAATYGFDELAKAAKRLEQASAAACSASTAWAEAEAAFLPLTLLVRRIEA